MTPEEFNNIFKYLYNLPDDFIDVIWRDHWLKEHFKEKFQKYQRSSKTKTDAFVSFVLSLDTGNLDRISKHINHDKS